MIWWEFGGVWWSLVEFGGVWWSLVVFGGSFGGFPTNHVISDQSFSRSPLLFPFIDAKKSSLQIPGAPVSFFDLVTFVGDLN